MINTSSQHSRRVSRPFSRREFLDRILIDDHHGTVLQDRIANVSEALHLAGVHTGKTLTLNQEAASQ